MRKNKDRFIWKHMEQYDGEIDTAQEGNEQKEEDKAMQYNNNGTDSNANPIENDFQAQPDKAAPASFAPRKEESYITEDVVINGSISAKCSLIIDGKIIGNVSSENDVIVCGSVEGDISAGCVKISSAKVKGNIFSKDYVSLVKDSYVEGDVSGKNIEVNGKITGNLTAQDSAAVMGNAEINGDITARRISVIEGAALNGNVKVVRVAAEAEEPPAYREAAAASDDGYQSRGF